MNDLDKVLIDTSVWIEFFRKNEPYYSLVLRLIDEDKVCITRISIAELIQGIKSEREIGFLKEFENVFTYLQDSPSVWLKTGELSFMLRQRGMTVGLSDLSVVAEQNNVMIFTLDRLHLTKQPFCYTIIK